MTGELWLLRRDPAHGLDGTGWTVVSRDDWLRAERASGFYPKGGGDVPATGGFHSSSTGIAGRQIDLAYWDPKAYDWDPEFRDAVERELADLREQANIQDVLNPDGTP